MSDVETKNDKKREILKHITTLADKEEFLQLTKEEIVDKFEKKYGKSRQKNYCLN